MDDSNGVAATGTRDFAVQGVSHLALVCSDMAATVDFYTEVLGMPLVMTLGAPVDDPDGYLKSGEVLEPGMAPGTQHFFFDMGNGDQLAFFWFPNGKSAAPGVAQPDNASQTSADGSMHHLAFRVPSDKLSAVWAHLEAHKVPFYFIAHSVSEISSYRTDNQLPFDQEKVYERRRRIKDGVTVDTLRDVTEDTYLASFYFEDPDGISLELAA
ncbi:MAG: Glyoxalase/bleomycin resistance protein/dioxygenase, partial [Pseudonocardiales bacterium]|nr:Glyoxalase/bleomycin resistance protein/dioxygenase [Pseudonocardiales bacterium]